MLLWPFGLHVSYDSKNVFINFRSFVLVLSVYQDLFLSLAYSCEQDTMPASIGVFEE